jgi:hypothetical protein
MYHSGTAQSASVDADRRLKYAECMKRFEVGARVVEPTYGLGSVIAVEDAYTRVQFDEHGVKKFLTSMSKLEPSDEPVPAGLRGTKPRKKRTTKKVAAAAVATVEPEE